MKILVGKPGARLAFAHGRRAEIRIDPFPSSSGYTEDSPAQIRHQPPITVIQAHDDVSARANQGHEAPKAGERIAGMVKNAVAEEHVELLRPKGQTKKICLYEPDTLQIVFAAETI